MTHQQQLLRRAIERVVVGRARDLDALAGKSMPPSSVAFRGSGGERSSCKNRIERQNPRARLAERAQRLTATGARLEPLRKRIVSDRANRLALTESRLIADDPESPLERGYAIVTLAGRALRDAREAEIGAQIEARLYRGSLIARVERVGHDE